MTYGNFHISLFWPQTKWYLAIPLARPCQYQSGCKNYQDIPLSRVASILLAQFWPWHCRWDYNRYPELICIFYEEVRIKQCISYILFYSWRFFYNSKLNLMATSLKTNAVVTRFYNTPGLGIRTTRLYSFDPLKPHCYVVKLGFTGVYIIFLITAQNIDCGTR